MSDTEIICDSPSLLNKQGYLEIPEGASALYQLKISLEAGKRMSESYATFKYYKEPTITKVSPALGPLRAGTTVTMYGTGFGQE